MRSNAKTPDEYVAGLPDERKQVISDIRKTINKTLPKGFKEGMAYGMISWAVPHELYPPGYHVDPELPLGYMGLASQKNYISLYSMCLYTGGKQLDWFTNEWAKHSQVRLSMNDVTRILFAIEKGDPHAAEQLLPLVYDELRKLAAAKLI